MNLYDDVLFKSGYEKIRAKFPFKEEKQVQPNFQNDFLDQFENVKVEDIKNMLFLTESERKKFDFLINKQDYISLDFFNKSKKFNDTNSNYDHLISFILEFYGNVMTPKIFQAFINDFKFPEKKTQTFSSVISKEECTRIFYNNFNKYQLNLKEDEDRAKFKKFLLSSAAPMDVNNYPKYSQQDTHVSKKGLPLIPDSYRSVRNSLPAESSRRK